MAMQAGVSTSKALILVGAGLTGSVILRSGRLSDVIAQLQEVVKNVNEVEFVPGRYDAVLLASQVRKLAEEIRELTLSRPVSIFNGNSDSSGGIASYLVPAAAIGAMGYCYMWWKGLSFSDVMYVTKQNMASAVSSVSKQLEQVSGALAATKRHLSQKLEILDGKVEEQKEMSKLIMNEVTEVTSSLSQIGCDLDTIFKMVAGMEGKLELLENKQDVTNSGLWYLCQMADSSKNGLTPAGIQNIRGNLLPNRSVMSIEDKSPKGLQFFSEIDDVLQADNSKINSITQNDSKDMPIRADTVSKTRIHRTYPMGISLSRGMLDL
ncbi:uncharacterized protein LOC113288078 [Papaver somniferum]|uniref:BZIP transcription factor 63_a04 n=1 Tax=Papaver somniferum TaxID=3469 RepID=K4JG21_PAPSO|nr:uncharacterized protein LOC113288078 [Papaver somniferum]AFU81796.1 BZIP transcription factor 63_a04 [Papaver somniferum]